MLVVFNEFRIGTYVLTDKIWIEGLHYLRINNTLKTFIYIYAVLIHENDCIRLPYVVIRGQNDKTRNLKKMPIFFLLEPFDVVYT